VFNDIRSGIVVDDSVMCPYACRRDGEESTHDDQSY
jgi:hypothetical protein